ncbi:hypothetical protein EPUS_07179 [Endocarpon pusillum Z07020]|uniref:C2H2-type domain-containing protein n=1 Tax=Endocarpon pusillum (strain Z07020 / HMAS-L-300199) TaxID=1263415 RepID=U1G9F8_ENDPU|nr:uncharacterized protein EPUS_07179 [Endocarpon pusillum Z07020]ERF68618.1 hypothetical protein EPUS_07179 [Endocarpon pusillum Z07020]
MVESPKSEASHESSPAAGRHHAAKDKECQYCHQHFTSSSLGRHLDQFIFRKKPDGVHNVEEIRRLRGGITRRTTKGGANSKHDREGSLSTSHITSPLHRDSPAEDVREDLNATPVEGYRIRVNGPNWQSTGVINGLPGSSTVSPALEHMTSTTGKRSYSSIETAAAKDILGLRGDLGSEKDTARALELALREVLDTIQAAHVQTKPAPSPFPIDVQSYTFPSLVLHLLPPPPTLLTSATPFASPNSFPISSPPDHTHLNLLCSTITSLITTWKSNLLNSPLPPNYPDTATYTTHIHNTASTHTGTALNHLDLAYKHYTSLPQHQQHEIWQIELARAYVSEKQKRKEVEESLEAVMVEARQLSGQVECLSRCQWPREMALWPPERRPIRSNVIREIDSGTIRYGKRRSMPTPGQGSAAEADAQQPLDDSDAEDKRWDYDRLVSKWKKVVREDAIRKRSLTLPAPAYTPPVPTTKSGNKTIETPTSHPNNANTPASSTAHAAAAAAPPTTTGTKPTKKEDSNPHFEPWCKKPRLVMEESNDCIMDSPRSNTHHQPQPQQQHQQQQRTQSNLGDLIAEASGQRNGLLGHQKQQQQQQQQQQGQGHYDGNGGGGFAFGNGTGNGNRDGEGAVGGRNGDG